MREFAIFAAAYLTYFGVRALTEASVPEALANAGRIAHVERLSGSTGRPRRSRRSSATTPSFGWRTGSTSSATGPCCCSPACCCSATGAPEYYLLRDVCLISGAVGLVIFALFPVAPPRLAGGGVVDTITYYAGGYRTVLPSSLVNEYAAMPSFHAGWSVLLGIVVFRASSRWPLRAFAMIMPTAMVVAVVVTANHFVLDVFVGTAIVLATLLMVDHRNRARNAPTLAGDGGLADHRIADPHGTAGRPPVRRRSPCGERPRSAAAGAGARPRSHRG